MLLESLRRHRCRSTADHISKPISCGRCVTVNYHPLLKLVDEKLLEGGNATGVRQGPC